MNVIVLYGQKETGKTTSLKIVYEFLKRINVKENNVFRYLDLNYYLDYLDVLTLNRQFTIDYLYRCLSKIIDNNKSDTNLIPLCETISAVKKEYALAPITSDIKVGLVLDGDYGEDQHHKDSCISKHLDIINGKCDIIICACRQSQLPLDSLLEYVRDKNSRAMFVPTTPFSPTRTLLPTAKKRSYLNNKMTTACFQNAVNVLSALRDVLLTI